MNLKKLIVNQRVAGFSNPWFSYAFIPYLPIIVKLRFFCRFFSSC